MSAGMRSFLRWGGVLWVVAHVGYGCSALWYYAVTGCVAPWVGADIETVLLLACLGIFGAFPVSASYAAPEADR